MTQRLQLPQNRTLLADLLSRQMSRIALLEREIAELMHLLDEKTKHR